MVNHAELPGFVQPVVAQLPWSYHYILLDKLDTLTERQWHAQQADEHDWLRNALAPQTGADLHAQQDKYALRDMSKPIGVSDYVTRLVESVPQTLEGMVPSVETLEQELSERAP